MTRTKPLTLIVLGLVATVAIILVMFYGMGSEPAGNNNRTDHTESRRSFNGIGYEHREKAGSTLPVRRFWLGQWKSSPRHALTLSDGRAARLEQHAESREQPQPLLKQIGDLAWRQRGSPQFIVGSGRAAVLADEPQRLADRDLSTKLVDAPYLQGDSTKPGNVYLIQTTNGHYAMVYLAAITPRAGGQEQAWVAWIYQPDGTARFPLASVRALYEQGQAMSATAGQVPAAAVVIGTAVLHSQGTGHANVLDLAIGGTKPPPVAKPDPAVLKRALQEPDGPEVQAIRAYNAAMASSADLFYDQQGERLLAGSGRITPLENLNPDTLEALDDEFLFEDGGSEDSGILRPKAISQYQTEPGRDLAFQTRDRRWVIARVIKRTDGSLSLAWAMQPDKSSRFPDASDLLPETVARPQVNELTTPLYGLVQNPNIPADELAARIEDVVQSGVDIHARVEPVGDTALHMAALYGSPVAVKALLDVGARVDVRSRGGATPLHYAAAFGRFDTAKVLLEHGADPLAETSQGQTAIQEAMQARPRHKELVELLKRHAQSIQADMALPAAAELGDVHAVRAALRRGEPVEGPDQHGRTPLYLAAAQGHVGVTELLLEAGAKAYVPHFPKQVSPFMVAVKQDHAGRNRGRESLIDFGGRRG